MSPSPRLAFASGSAAAGLCALLLSGRLDATAFAVALVAAGARAAASVASMGGGPVASAAALRSLRRQAMVAPAWILAVTVAAFRSGSVGLADIRGANAVLGPAISHGGAMSVAASWLALAAGILAAAGPGFGRPDPAGERGRRGAVRGDGRAARLEAVAVAAQIGLLATLFAGPQISGVLDGVAWAAVLVGIAVAVALLVAFPARPWGRGALASAVAWRTEIPAAAVALGAAALALALVGGRG